MRILLIADTPAGKPQSKDDRIAQLESENTLLKEQVAADRAADAARAAEEKEIAKKVGVGLTRDQAIAVIRRQREHDAALAAKQAKRLPRLKEIIANSKGDITAARRAARIEFPDLDGGEFAKALETK